MSFQMFKDVEDATLARFLLRGDEWCVVVPTGTRVSPGEARAVRRADGETRFVNLIALVERRPDGDVWSIRQEPRWVGCYRDGRGRLHADYCDWTNDEFQYAFDYCF